MTIQELWVQRAHFDTNRRWWVIAAIAGVVIIFYQNQTTIEYWPVLAVIGLAVVYNFTLTLLTYFTPFTKLGRYLELTIDLILISAIIYFTGGVFSSPLYILFPLLIVLLGRHLIPALIILAGSGALIASAGMAWLGSEGFLSVLAIWDRALLLVALTVATDVVVRVYVQEKEKLQKEFSLARKSAEEGKICNQELESRIQSSVQQVEEANMMLVKKNLAFMAFAEIHTAMTSTYDSGKLLTLVMDTAVSLLKANAGVLLLKKYDTDTVLRVRVSRGLDAKHVRSLQVKLGEGVEGEVAETGEAQLIPDLDQVPRCKPIHPESKSKMCMPLRSKKRLAGVITVESTQPDAFGRKDMELFGTLGSQASEVLQNVEMYEDLRNKAERLSLLYDVSKSVSTINSLTKLFDTILERAREVIKARQGFLLIYDKDTGRLVVKASLGPQGHIGRTVRTERGIAGYVYTQLKPVLVQSVEKHPLYDAENDWIYGGRNLLVTPLNDRENVFGVICLCDRAGGRQFTVDDLDLLSALATPSALAITRTEQQNRIQEDYLNAIHALAAAVDAKDHYTHGHSHKVMVYATAIARELGLSEKDIKKIKYSALLHDVGKIGISEAVLNKPSKLTPKEFDTIAMHPILGVSIVQNIKSLKDLIPTILYHHERYSGGGYPEGRAGNSIPLGARIVAIADAWDVMTSDRAYRKALPISVAVAELKNFAGTQFDPDMVDAFLRSLEKDEKFEPVGEEERPDLLWDEEEISGRMT